ncbi:uncharacterized protein EI90DRAFT_2259047 [Cantharellus anzutake]|uniref:uncharacterized protein n=1 Tax=Cantharellus anzutake TaxID=1750568 RepID=UPI001907A235|nr:uncharacterized protein EI90DRAFT_2259047 [Cantharellus anzutake]KAF8339614.1 hypothetical protein EI90DRAFT_2259047 [Cantharellus anzutake]
MWAREKNQEQAFVYCCVGRARTTPHQVVVPNLSRVFGGPFESHRALQEGPQTGFGMLKRKEPDRIENYEIQGLLGRGGTSQVYRATCRRGRLRGRQVAIKIVPVSALPTPPHISHHVRSTALHAKLHHPSIISLLSSFHTSTEYYHVLELCAAGPLSGYLMGRTSHRLTEGEARGLLRPLIDGLLYLGKQKVVHRDLKADNILLTEDMRLKLADFGLATQLMPPAFKATTFCGTPNYLSPEVIAHRPYDAMADVWALGCFMISILTGKPPFQGLTIEATLARASNASYVLPKSLSPEASDLIRKLLQIDRLTLSEILEHPFFHLSFPVTTLYPSVVSGHSTPLAAPERDILGLYTAETDLPSTEMRPRSATLGNPPGRLNTVFLRQTGKQKHKGSGKNDRQLLDRPVLGSIENATPIRPYSVGTCGESVAAGCPDRKPRKRTSQALGHGGGPTSHWLRPSRSCIDPAFTSHARSSRNTRTVKRVASLNTASDSAIAAPSDPGLYAQSCWAENPLPPVGARSSSMLQTAPVRPGMPSQSSEKTTRSKDNREKPHGSPNTHDGALQVHEAKASLPARPGQRHKIGSLNVALPDPGLLSEANAKTSSEGRGQPTPIDLTLLPPKVYETPHGTITISDQPRELLVDLRKSERAAGRAGKEVLKISENGMMVTVFELFGHNSLEGSSLPKQWKLDNLPKNYLKWYRFAGRFIDMLRSRTPKFIFFTPRAKCTVMSNGPLPDVELTFPACGPGVKETKRGAAVADLFPTMRIRLLRRTGHVEVYRSIHYVSQPTLTANVPGFGEGEWTKRVAAIPNGGHLSEIPLFSAFPEEREGLTHMDECLSLCSQLESLSFSHHNDMAKTDDRPLSPPLQEELWKSLAESTTSFGTTTLHAGVWAALRESSAEDHNRDQQLMQNSPKSALVREVRRRLSSSSRSSPPSALIQASRNEESSPFNGHSSGQSGLEHWFQHRRNHLKAGGPRHTLPQLLTPSSFHPESNQSSLMSSGHRPRGTQSPETRFIPALGWCLRYSAEDGHTIYKVMFLDGTSLEVDQNDSSALLTDRNGQASDSCLPNCSDASLYFMSFYGFTNRASDF